MLTLSDIYENYSRGSEGFAEAVVTHCGYDISTTEAVRLGSRCETAAQFESEWEDAAWWTDEENA